MEIKELITDICKNKKNIVKLNNENLKKYKTNFYSQPFKIWQLDLLWEYIWSDISFEEVKNIFKIE